MVSLANSQTSTDWYLHPIGHWKTAFWGAYVASLLPVVAPTLWFDQVISFLPSVIKCHFCTSLSMAGLLSKLWECTEQRMAVSKETSVRCRGSLLCSRVLTLCSSFSRLSDWLSSKSKKQKCWLPKMVWILVWQLPKSKREEKRWEITFIEHLLCYQTLLNSFNTHEVTSNMKESRGPNNVVRTLSPSPRSALPCLTVLT